MLSNSVKGLNKIDPAPSEAYKKGTCRDLTAAYLPNNVEVEDKVQLLNLW